MFHKRALTLVIRGIDHPDPAGHNRRFEVELCAPGDWVELRLEPGNEFDPFAVAIHSKRGTRLGFVAAERAPWIGAKMRAGVEVRAIFQGQGAGGAFIRVTLDGSDPVIPPPSDRDGAATGEVGPWAEGADPDYGWPD